MLTAGCTENGTDDEKGHIDIDVTVLKGAFDLEPADDAMVGVKVNVTISSAETDAGPLEKIDELTLTTDEQGMATHRMNLVETGYYEFVIECGGDVKLSDLPIKEVGEKHVLEFVFD